MKTIYIYTIITLLSANLCMAQNSSPYWSLAGNSNATSSSKLGTTNNISVRFYTNNSQRMIINSAAGLVGIGTTSPTDQLHVNSPSGTNPLRIQVNGSTKFLVNSNGGASIGSGTTPPSGGLYVSGNTGIGTSSPTQKLHVVGRGLFTAGLTVSSGGITSNSTGFGSTGVYGSGADYGVRGDGGTNGTGVYGTSDYIGVTGSNNGSGTGAYGYSYGGTGVRAVGGSYGVDASGGSYGIYAYSYLGTGVYGYSSSNIGGIFNSINYYGITASSNNAAYAAVFYGNVYSSGTYQTSDESLKRNIQDFSDVTSIIKQLKPQHYNFSDDARYASLHLPKGMHYGLMAQDVEKILPNLVSESPHRVVKLPLSNGAPGPTDGPKPAMPAVETDQINLKAVNYVELIPILIKALQEQDAKIEALTKMVEKLSALGNLSQSTLLKSSLLQNITPNPNSSSAKITYTLGNGVVKALLLINDAAGNQVKQVELPKSGYASINTSEFLAGTYFCTLVVNGISIDSRKMVVAR